MAPVRAGHNQAVPVKESVLRGVRDGGKCLSDKWFCLTKTGGSGELLGRLETDHIMPFLKDMGLGGALS